MNKTELQYHLVFVTKYRKKILTDEILNEIKEIIYNTAKLHYFKIIEIGSENQDHIHIVIKIRPTQSISLLVQLLKQYTTYYMWQLHPVLLRKFYWYKNYFWNSGYFCSTLGNVSKEIVLEYVEKQK